VVVKEAMVGWGVSSRDHTADSEQLRGFNPYLFHGFACFSTDCSFFDRER